MAKHRRERRDAGQDPDQDAGRELHRAADRLLVRTVWRGGHWAALLGITSIAGAAADTLLPAVAGKTVDVVLRAAEQPGTASRTGHWLAGCVGLIVAIVACEAAGQFATGMSTAGATEWLRLRLAAHVFAAAGAVPAVAAIIPPVGSVIALALIDPWLAAAFAAGLPALAIALRVFVRDASNVAAHYQRAQGAITARLLDALAGARTIAAAGTCDQEAARVLVPLAQVRLHGRASWRIQARIAAQGSLIVPLLQVMVLAVAGVELAAHRISPGELLAASQYAVLGAGVGAAISRLGQLSRARAGARRVAEPLAEPAPWPGTRTLPPGPGRLWLSSVTVRRDGEPVLDRVDVTFPAGAVVAVVGRSGSGKSLLAAVAGRLLDPDQGEVRLDGVALTSLDRMQLRRAVVYAFDRPALFGATMEDAVAFGAQHPGSMRVRLAAQDASAYDFLRRLPAGLDTPLEQAKT